MIWRGEKFLTCRTGVGAWLWSLDLGAVLDMGRFSGFVESGLTAVLGSVGFPCSWLSFGTKLMQHRGLSHERGWKWG